MRRILITPKIKLIAQSYAKEMESATLFAHGESPKERLYALSENLKKTSTCIKILKNKASKGHPAVYTNYKGNIFPALSYYVKAIYDHYDGLCSLIF